jgi:DNA-binding transcriptional MerR regulator
MKSDLLTIEQLVALANTKIRQLKIQPSHPKATSKLTPRTVRYYLQNGVIPAAIRVSGQIRFDQTHVDALVSVKEQQSEGKFLDEISQERVDDKPPLFVMPEPNLHVSMMITQPLAMKSVINIDRVQAWMKPQLAVQEQWKIEIGDGLVLTGNGAKPSSKEAEEAQKVLLKWMSKKGK